MPAQIFSLLFTIFKLLSSDITPYLYSLYSTAPPEVKAIYWTAYTAGNENRRKDLLEFIVSSEMNSVVIDVKDSSGRVFFDTSSPLIDDLGSEDTQRIGDIQEILSELKKHNIYTIARIVVFQDPYLAQKMPEVAIKRTDGRIWKDFRGLAWVDPASRFVWEYNKEVAKSAILQGFQEVNFDYIRFPSDGPLADMQFPFFETGRDKNEVIAEFFRYISHELRFYPANISVDVFGMTLVRSDGLNIGQRYEDALDYVDFICPMVYPSHYPRGFLGYENPAEFPYEVLKESFKNAKEKFQGRRAKLRPWLQDFDLGAVYDREKIRAQIQAAEEAGAAGWMIWNSSNIYTEEAYIY